MLYHYSDCHYAQCHVLCNSMVNVSMLSVVMLIVVAPKMFLSIDACIGKLHKLDISTAHRYLIKI
jgi:hypothetical protein